MKRKYALPLLILAAIVILTICASAGATFILPWKALSSTADPSVREIFLMLRIPRTLAAFVVGASLGVSGALFQSVLRNPLADPYTIGVSGGASLGAAAGIIAGLPYPTVTLLSLGGGMAVSFAVNTFARRQNASPSSIILAGVSMSLILSSGVTLLFALGESRSVHKALLWLMGDFSLARISFLIPTAGASAVLIAAAFLYGPHLDLMTYGPKYARGSGVSRADTAAVFWIASTLTALAVSLCGVVAFAGLVTPHIARRIVGQNHRLLIPSCAVAGGCFLAVCDTIGRCLANPYELPSGVVTGIAGGFFLLVLILGKKQR
ncbi:MAG TPA: iron ABC transporter permease [Spirochaetota bacterium]|nr:iron ABC transporter permease [Spirochaetota bacterium]